MRFGLIHRIMTDALATLGLLALVTSGELNRWVSAMVLVGLALSLGIPERWQDKSPLKTLAVVAPLSLLFVQTARLFAGSNILPLAVEFAAGLQVVRLATRRGAAHDQQVIVLALLHLIAGTVLGGGLAYGLCFIGFLVVAPGALVLSHLRREVEGNYRQGARDRTGLPVDVPRILRSRRVIGKPFLTFTCLLSVPIFLFTAVLFVLFPRVGLSLLLLNHSPAERMIGFSDKVDLGGVGKLRSDPTIAMRVEYANLPENPPPRLALYLRGTAFDRYDGRAWSRTLTQRTTAERIGPNIFIRRYPNPSSDSRLIIDLEPIDPLVLFLPTDTVSIKLLSRGSPLMGQGANVFKGPEGEFKYSSTNERGARYEVFMAPKRELGPEPLSASERARYVTLPPKLPGRIAALAERWAAGKQSPFAVAKAIEGHLRTEYSYDLESVSGAAGNPLDHFLFESKRGHCEFYSTAMAILLRTRGIPSRNVTGFIGGSYNRFGRYYAVRQGDAHSWVEAYIDGQGWTRFDPTPPAAAAPQSELTGALAFMRDLVEAVAQRWNHNVIGYDRKQQVEIFQSVRRLTSVSGGASLKNLFSSPGRGLALLAGVALILWAVSRYLRRRRNGAEKGNKELTPREVANLQVVMLYKQLEAALIARGVPRPASTPPLAHARALLEMGHPVGREAFELTEMYLEARFGARLLSDAERETFVKRARTLRQNRDSGIREAAA